MRELRTVWKETQSSTICTRYILAYIYRVCKNASRVEGPEHARCARVPVGGEVTLQGPRAAGRSVLQGGKPKLAASRAARVLESPAASGRSSGERLAR